MRDRIILWASAVVLAVLVVAAVAGPWLAPYEPGGQDIALGPTGPGAGHWLGTDDLGRDVFSRLLAGAGTALWGPAVVAVGTTVLGTTLGLVAGYHKGWIDAVLMRVADLMIALPGLLVLIVLVGIMGGGYGWSIAALIVLYAPFDTRVIRSLALAQRELAYVEAARTLGLRSRTIMFRHILPNLAPTVLANVLMTFVVALVSLAGLSFLGIGLPVGTPDWGLMIEENRALLDLNPWAALAPAVLIALAAIAATLLGDGLFEQFNRKGAGRAGD
ncbi:ABC transporter permease [Nonomuraea spiralis]|uniref:ABC transporter permease n=1 Tax=Nonomuraea TaxID=83681 RepID=UPI000F78E58A|nr:ABC transporter permease [Nonomuraea sp. WAC 01424]RSM99508.1 ABC transporter permease [Nonomuraea sp. WAC 01424]